LQGSTVSQERSFASLNPDFTPGVVAASGTCGHCPTVTLDSDIAKKNPHRSAG